jgi:signal transduction histidine kinase
MKNRLGSLPLQLLAFVVLPLLVLLMIVAFGGVALHQSEMRDMLGAHNRQVVAGTAAGLSEQLVQRQRALVELAAAVDNEEQAQVALERSGWLRVFFDGGVALYAADGRLLAALPSVPDSSPLRAWDTRWAESPFFPLQEPGQVVVKVVITTPPQPAGIRAAGLVSLDKLSSINVLASLHAAGDTDSYILGPDGTVLYHSDPTYVGQRFSDVAARAVSESFERSDAKGHDVVTTVARIPAVGWTLVQEERWKETLSPLMRYSQAAPLALVPGLLIAIGTVWFGIRRIVYPLRRLEAHATELAWGDFAAIKQPVGGIEEIRRLQATLQHMAQRVQAAQATMHDYIGAITHAQEDERQRLARELHDQTLQALVALDHRQQMLKPYLRDDPAASEGLSTIRAMIVEIVNDLRRSVRALRPVYLEELGLAPALQMLARDLGLDDKMAVHFEKTGVPQRLPPEHEMALYRIAQEALNNVWQHSGASQLWLTMRFEDMFAQVSVRDNGKGFVAPRHAAELSASGQKHFGIIGMYERAALIGAHLQVQSNPGEGTTVTVRVPIPSEPGTA